MLLEETDTGFLFLGHLKALDGLNNRVSFLPERALEQGNAIFRVEGLAVDKVIRNSGSGLTEHVGNDRVKSDVANGKGVLEAVLLAGFAGNQLIAVASILAKETNSLVRYKAAGYKSEPEQVADPLGILRVVLITFDGRYPFRIGNRNADGVFQQIVNWNVVFAGALHADVKAVVFDKPPLEVKNGIVESGESFLSVGWDNTFRGNQCGDEKRFVNIDAAADRVNDPQSDPSSRWICEERSSDWIAAH
jgi:hypothetical protein